MFFAGTFGLTFAASQLAFATKTRETSVSLRKTEPSVSYNQLLKEGKNPDVSKKYTRHYVIKEEYSRTGLFSYKVKCDTLSNDLYVEPAN